MNLGLLSDSVFRFFDAKDEEKRTDTSGNLDLRVSPLPAP